MLIPQVFPLNPERNPDQFYFPKSKQNGISLTVCNFLDCNKVFIEDELMKTIKI